MAGMTCRIFIGEKDEYRYKTRTTKIFDER